MKPIFKTRAFSIERISPKQTPAPAAHLKSLAATTLLLLMLLLSACSPESFTDLPVATPLPSATAVSANDNVGMPLPGDTPTTGDITLLTDTPPALDTAAPLSTPTSVAANPTDTPSDATSSAEVNAIKSVIQRANQEEVQAFATNDPSVMADTATAPYYQQMVQSYNDMVNSGITAVKLVNLAWGPVTLQDANTAQANTTETWLTTFSDGSTMNETDPNVYTLVLQGGTWKVQDDEHPNTRTLQPEPGTPGAAPTSAPGSAATPIASAIPSGSSVEQSSNWAGYTATGGTFTAVSGTWVVPHVSAGSGNTVAADATWVGIGGANSTDLIQAGTQATVQGGQVVYSAWWETLPQAAQDVPLDIAAGDTVTVSINQQADGTWHILIRDATSGQSFEKNMAYKSTLSSAEWIEESPTVGRRTLLPLDDFGTVTFTNATTTENGKQVSIAQAKGKPVSMYGSAGQTRRGRPSGQAGQPLAQPSALGADGASFSVTRTNAPAPVVVP